MINENNVFDFAKSPVVLNSRCDSELMTIDQRIRALNEELVVVSESLPSTRTVPYRVWLDHVIALVAMQQVEVLGLRARLHTWDDFLHLLSAANVSGLNQTRISVDGMHENLMKLAAQLEGSRKIFAVPEWSNETPSMKVTLLQVGAFATVGALILFGISKLSK
jgi:hypothetical protein